MNDRIADILAKLPDARAATEVVQEKTGWRYSYQARMHAYRLKAEAKYRSVNADAIKRRARTRNVSDIAAEMILNAKLCAYCDAEITRKTITIDHIIPLSKGGKHEIGNIAPCCRRCNSSKGNKTDWIPPNKRMLTIDD